MATKKCLDFSLFLVKNTLNLSDSKYKNDFNIFTKLALFSYLRKSSLFGVSDLIFGYKIFRRKFS